VSGEGGDAFSPVLTPSVSGNSFGNNFKNVPYLVVDVNAVN